MTTPPMAASNEAEPDQLEVARAQDDTYARALQAMDEEPGAVTRRAGDYLAAFVQQNAKGMYELEGGRLVWREATEEANAHLEIAVADAADGRLVPGEGPYTVRVRIDPPTFMRHDPVNGKRYERPVEVVFRDRRFTPGRKPSPDAQPRAADSSYAGG